MGAVEEGHGGTQGASRVKRFRQCLTDSVRFELTLER